MASLWSNAFFDDVWSNAVAIRLDDLRPDRDPDDGDFIEVSTRIGLKRAELAERVKAALEAGDEKHALRLMREYCGLEQRP